MRNTTGYFFAASNAGGLTSQYCTRAPPAPVVERLSGAAKATSFRHERFSSVSPGLLRLRAGSRRFFFEWKKEDLGRRGQRRLREDEEAGSGLQRADGPALFQLAGRSTREGHFEEISSSLSIGGEVNGLAVPAQAELLDGKVRALEQRPLRLRLPVVEVEVPAIGLETGAALGAHEDRGAVGRVRRVEVRRRVQGGQLRGGAARDGHQENVFVRRKGLRVVPVAIRDERDLPAVG